MLHGGVTSSLRVCAWGSSRSSQCDAPPATRRTARRSTTVWTRPPGLSLPFVDTFLKRREAKCSFAGACQSPVAAAEQSRSHDHTGTLSASTFALRICGAVARRSSAWASSAAATCPRRCASRPASLLKASKIANVLLSKRTANQATVSGSAQRESERLPVGRRLHPPSLALLLAPHRAKRWSSDVLLSFLGNKLNPLDDGLFCSERRMILHRVLERRLQPEESLIYGRWVVTIERDHLCPRLAAADHLESIGLDPLDDGVGDRGGWLPREAELGPARFDFIIGVSVPPG